MSLTSPGGRPETSGSGNSLMSAAAVTAATVLVAPKGALPPPCAAPGIRQPKWRLCFRMDRDAMSAEMANKVAWQHQRDFFVTVIDPPVSQQESLAFARNSPPPPFFASEVACQVANILVGRPFLMQLPGQSFSGRTVAAIGKDCVAAGLVAAMLGARVIFVCDRHLAQHVRQNVQLYLKDTLDYTKMKNPCVTVASAGVTSVTHLDGWGLREQLGTVSLDVILATESASLGLASPDASETELGLFDILGRLVPAGSTTRVLLICDVTRAHHHSHDEYFDEEDHGGSHSSAHWEAVPDELDVPPSWRVRPFCLLLRRVPVLWAERKDGERKRQSNGVVALPARRHLRPMGASSSKCGSGGHPQRSDRKDKAANPEWAANNRRLKEALALHNRTKQDNAMAFITEAMAWAEEATKADSDPAFMHAGGIISDMLARSTASILSSSASARGASRDHCGSRDGRAETADTCNASIASCDLSPWGDGQPGLRRKLIQQQPKSPAAQTGDPEGEPSPSTGAADTPGTPFTDVEDSRPNTAPATSWPAFVPQRPAGSAEQMEYLPSIPRTPRLPEDQRWPRPARVVHSTSYGLPYTTRFAGTTGRRT
mmetsp:Transcript_36534/g.83956  ORF Transcript_36534/g.83956 Transcript_36534/m.83956 type:complete len:600 (+) Transcript_36534:172-1971(+)